MSLGGVFDGVVPSCSYVIIKIYAINVVNYSLTCILVISSFSLDAFEATEHMYAHENCLNYSVENDKPEK